MASSLPGPFARQGSSQTGLFYEGIKPHLIRHVHWSDNYLYDTRGRNDSHASVGKGSLPTELHRGIKRLDAVILLEHFYTIDELEQELEYVTAL